LKDLLEKAIYKSGENFCMVIEGPFGISNFLLPFFFLTIIFGNPNSTGGHVHEKKDEGHGFKNRAQIEFPLKTV